MIDAGMNVARINFDPKDIDDHQLTLRNLHEAISVKSGRNCKVLVDLKGFEIELAKPMSSLNSIQLQKDQ